MGSKVIIEPVTRIEGHAKVVVHLGDDQQVERAFFHVNEFRGFEKFCEGRMYFEMPQITPRICGICPVSHHLVSVKACDQILGVTPTRPARLLRELMHMGQTIQSHSMHFFELAGPDLLLGFDADPAIRNVAGLVAANPELVHKAIQLRRFGQSLIATLGDRRIHPTFAVPGGVNQALDSADRDTLLAEIDTMIGYVLEALAIIKDWADRHQELLGEFASFSTGYLGMVGQQNSLELYDGPLRHVGPDREELHRFDGSDYLEYIGEHVEPWTYLKFPFFRDTGWPDGVYRVGPLGRLNAADKIATPLAQVEYEIYQQICGGRTVEGTLYYHYARLIEDLYAVERAREILEDPEVLSKDLLINAKITNLEGVGVLEAPRGTLFHHYWIDENGKLERVNLIVATGNNNYAMSRAVEEVAKRYLDGTNIREGALNRIEAAIRAYDPCLSCSTHAFGQMPLELILLDPDGTEVRRIHRF
ncbi:MAG: Ni/Fe hydrogenase subunit alpha [Planctomycetaceae bacterium]|nr:MAG: Ni/Fe hydrogenase subunit alpha [Planctomycetaceae bacterium]